MILNRIKYNTETVSIFEASYWKTITIKPKQLISRHLNDTRTPLFYNHLHKYNRHIGYIHPILTFRILALS